MKKTLTKDVIAKIQNYLGGCSQKVICRYLGVSTQTLSQNIEKDFSKIADSEIGKRLDTFLHLLEFTKSDAALSPGVLHRLLTLPAYEYQGWKIDVVSAIHSGVGKEKALKIFKQAVDVLQRPIDKQPSKQP